MITVRITEKTKLVHKLYYRALYCPHRHYQSCHHRYIPPALAVRKLMQELVQPKHTTEREGAGLEPAEDGEAGAGPVGHGEEQEGVESRSTRRRAVVPGDDQRQEESRCARPTGPCGGADCAHGRGVAQSVPRFNPTEDCSYIGNPFARRRRRQSGSIPSTTKWEPARPSNSLATLATQRYATWWMCGASLESVGSCDQTTGMGFMGRATICRCIFRPSAEHGT